MERIFMQAQRFGISPEEYVQQAQQASQLGAIFADVRRGKALATVVQAATILGPDGDEVDLSELFAPATPEDAAAAAEAAVESITEPVADDDAAEDAVVVEDEDAAAAPKA